MNLLLLDADEVVDGRAVVGGRRARHLRDVLRVAPGDRLRAGIARGPLATAVVTAVSGDTVALAVDAIGAPPEPPPVDLVLAVPRPKSLSRALEAAASFGVRRIDLVNAWRVDKSYLQSPRLAPDALARSVRAGCEQGGTTWVPDVVVHSRLMALLDGPLADADPDPRRRVLLHPRADRWMEDIVRGHSRVVCAIGPDGGWTDREVRTFEARGFCAVSLGPAVLRVDVAVAATFAQLDLLHRQRAG